MFFQIADKDFGRAMAVKAWVPIQARPFALLALDVFAVSRLT